MFYIKNTCFVESVFFIFYSFYNMWKGDDKYIVSDLVSVVEDNKKMIYKLANSFSKENSEDLFQTGVVGLIEAYNNYIEGYGVKFSTYAYSYILGEMKKYIRENKSVKISREIQYLSYRLDKLIDLLSQKYKRTPTTSELSMETGIDEWKIIEALNIKGCVRSLDEPVGEDDKMTVMDVVSVQENTVDSAEFEELMNLLNDNERKFIEERYILDKSQSEVATITGYSQAKVSRIENKIKQKLKKHYAKIS